MYYAVGFWLILSYFKVNVYAQDHQEQRNCTCVPYYQCADETGNVITDGTDLFDPRKLQDAENTCTGYFDVCCYMPNEARNSSTEVLEKPKGCGYQHSGSFSWTAALFYQETNGQPRENKCGAALIHPQVLVTAAHCLTTVTNNGKWNVRINNLQKSIQKIIIHFEYDPLTLKNDLALLFLKNPVETSDKLNVICLPSPGIVLDETRCIVSSWSNVCPTATSTLKLIKLPIVHKEACVKFLRSTRLGAFFQLHKSFLCAGGEANNDACIGDGGSPLVCPIANQPGRFHQVGIVSWGIGCGEVNIPGVYVNLGLFREWIDEKMSTNGFDVNVYRY